MDFAPLHSTCVPPEHRFDWWCELISRDVAPARITSEHADDFRASAGALDLGPVRLTTMSFPPIRSQRTPALIRHSDPEGYELALLLDSGLWFSQARSDTRLSAGDLALWSTSLPYDGRGLSGTGTGTFSAVILHLPRPLLSVPGEKVEGLLASSMQARSGMGAILSGFLRNVVAQAPSLTAQDTERLGITAWELTNAFLAHRLNAEDRLPPEARTRVLLARISAFIDDNLADPQLSPTAVAAHHHISVRLLHQLFRQRQETVSATIRRRRLEHCHKDLSDPRLHTLPIHAVAARWGLADAAGFSRAFRAAYGVSPREHRHAALRSARPAPGGTETRVPP
ncbi:helix-turn-helix domain-containing protein [Streptomyces sp. NPDC051907]|uniref:AraC-like ligand-binding domain-containing protein n=1 Tax=Streptomyces sp. NPDC051907 TaxID=3155284 RepID=UPI0034325407